MKKHYESPEMDISTFSFEDIVTVSGGGDNWYGEEDTFGG